MISISCSEIRASSYYLIIMKNKKKTEEEQEQIIEKLGKLCSERKACGQE